MLICIALNLNGFFFTVKCLKHADSKRNFCIVYTAYFYASVKLNSETSL